MIKEYYIFIKEYLKIVEFKKSHFFFTFLTAFLYKGFQLTIPLFASFIIKYASISNWNMTFISIGLLGSSYLLYRLFLYMNYRVYGYNINYCYNHLQDKVFSTLLQVDDQFTKKVSRGKLINCINSDIIDIGDMMDDIVEVIMSFLQFICIIVIVCFYNWIFGLLFMICFTAYILVYNFLDKKRNIYYEKQLKNMDQYGNLLHQILDGLPEIKTFDMLPQLIEKLDTIKDKFSKNFFLRRKYYVWQQNECKLIHKLFKLFLYFVMIFFIAKGKFTVDILVLMIGYFENSVNYIEDFFTNATTIREVSIAVSRIKSILYYKNKVNIVYGINDLDDIDGIVEFKNVNFHYKDKQILKDFNLTLFPNKVNVIVGESGTGKTTIFNLLLRLYKVDSGSIYVDHVNIYDYSKKAYLSNIAVTNQKPFIFNMSIRQNLDLIDSNIENQIEVCKRVGIHDFITSLPRGYQTILQEDATNVSGGQKQLISLARTLLSKSEVLLFDEISSALDPETEKIISTLLDDLKKDHTIIMITHKPDLMKRADRIIVVHQGKIVGDGKHKELIGTNEYYQYLQSRKSASSLGVFPHD